MPISTLKYKMSHTSFVMHLIRLVIGKWIALPVILIAVGLVMTFVWDIRMLIVTMMFVLIVAPMLLAFLYIYYGLSPGCWLNIIEKIIKVSERGIELRLYIPKKIDVADESEVEIIEQARYIDWGEVKMIKRDFKYLIICMKERPLSFIYVPYTVFQTDEECVEFFNIVKQAAQKKGVKIVM